MNKLYSNKLTILLLIMPAILLFTVFVIYPTVQSVQKSFYQWDGLSKPVFNSIDHYIRLINDPIFLTSNKNALIFTVIITVIQIVLGTLLALLVNRPNLPGRRFFKASFFIPVVLSATITCQLWVSMLDGQNGLLNKVFELLGSDYRQDWLGSSSKAIIIMAVVNAWQYTGYHMILIYAGLKSIPSHYREAAMLDGANAFQLFFRVIRPLLSEIYKLCLIIAVLGGLKAFEQMFLMTNGGPVTSTYTLSMMIYRAVFNLNDYGYGSAIAVVLMLQCLLALLVINRFVARERISY